jgi:transcriptional regulator with XRE-family HTH domain
MATDESRTHRRRGWWIRVARDRKGIKIEDLAKSLGYKDGKGTVSLWESGARPVPSGKFPVLQELLELPDRYLVKPPETDEERLGAAIRIAADAERRDWESEEGRGPEDDGGPGASPGTRSA